MHVRTTVPALLLAVLLVTAGCSGFVNDTAPETNAPAQSSPSTDGDTPTRSITVAAGGQIQTQPDQVILRVAVEATGQDASTVRQQIAENVSQMRRALADMGIESGQIRTVGYDIRNRQRFDRPDSEQPPFWGRHAFAITLTDDLNQTGKVIVTPVENGATSVNDVRFTLSEEKRRELYKEALADAMDNAREQAVVIAEGANLSITGVGSVRTADIRVHPVRFEAQALAGDAGGGAPTSIEGGAVTVRAQVQVAYNATVA